MRRDGEPNNRLQKKPIPRVIAYSRTFHRQPKIPQNQKIILTPTSTAKALTQNPTSKRHCRERNKPINTTPSASHVSAQKYESGNEMAAMMIAIEPKATEAGERYGYGWIAH